MGAESHRAIPDDDDALLALLAEALEDADPVPAWVLRAGEASYVLHDPALDAELAELIADSAVDAEDAPEAVAVRSTTVEPRLLTFEAADLAVEVEVADGTLARLIRGRVVPRQELSIRVVTRDGGGDDTSTPEDGLATDAFGGFAVDGVPPGPFRLVCRRPGRRPVATSWILLD